MSPPLPPLRSVSALLLLVALFSCSLHSVLGSVHDCSALGFVESLHCAECVRLEQVVGDEQLTNECHSCCVSSSAAAVGQYLSGVLQVCTCNLRRYPAVQEFVHTHSARFEPALKVEYVRGLTPTLVMKAHDGTEETIGVQTWKLDTFEEFFNAKLQKE
jgi:hypothetical protein